jgi:uncharacterized protein
MIRQFVSSQQCAQCHGCCRFKEEDSVWLPSLLNSEIELLLSQGLPQTMISPDKKMRVVPFNKENTFLCALCNSEENKCKIYDIRPLECQLYPFLLCRQESKVYLAVDTNCPGVEGKIKSAEFQAYTAYLLELLQSPLYIQILKDNPQIVQAYQDVLLLTAL